MNLKFNLCLIPLHRKVKQLIKILTNGEVKTRLGMDFSYYNDSKYIDYALVTADTATAIFCEFMEERAEKNGIELDEMNYFLACILHEVGHFYTWDDNLYNECEVLREEYDKESLSVKSWEERKKIYKKYHSLPEEIAATDWAIKFIGESPEFCNEWGRIIYNEINKFVKRMKIEG